MKTPGEKAEEEEEDGGAAGVMVNHTRWCRQGHGLRRLGKPLGEGDRLLMKTNMKHQGKPGANRDLKQGFWKLSMAVRRRNTQPDKDDLKGQML